MIVTCPNCQTRYNLPDDKVPAGGAKVKCSKCAHVFKAELPAATPEDEVENLLEEESQAPDSGVGDDFDETFDEVASGGGVAQSDDESADEAQAGADDESESGDSAEASPTVDEAPEDAPTETTDPAPSGDDMPDEDMPGMDDLFDDSETAPEPEEGATPTGGLDEATARDVESLFGDDESDLFEDDSESDEDDDLFDEEDGSDADLFADSDSDTEDESDGDQAEDNETDPDEEYEGEVDFGLDEEPQKSNRKSLGCLITLLVVILAVSGILYFKAWTLIGLDLGSYFQNVPYIGKLFMEDGGDAEDVPPGESPAENFRKIQLINVNQYYVANEKTGNLFVVEGKAVNKFSTPKEQIKVEVVLYDGKGNALTSQAFLCGNVLSQFQLQVQTREEIEQGLASEVGILSNNTFIRPGASTPFMAVFFDTPPNVQELIARVVAVGEPE
ncbi:DUF3426 domain-containing protein [Pseudodesulfovibrio piezophilus]|uniref:Zinc finger/thioredoxin putative domain-containing protein n=1 Tax=Pseudodesulfovibrio piezophilus (strain DSM 21447 / JCM 15486 / C1TLV30) TaxID=1322246 RepID=M1WTP1_PSEP2|nr:DUF3426 domain-containing protein [Pseudodesulfovibrio piezophilus]CCH49787.1 conserved protein of unknown function [Pseudodesulfovibrio piezophilus C1TLV30]